MRLIPLALGGLATLGGMALPGLAQAPGPPALAWPVDCRVGRDCAIQHYVDRDPSPAVKDYACGARSYDGHNGVDIRLPDMAAQRRGVSVLAAADGQVLRVRDGMADRSIATTGRAAVKDVECGNGVVIAHVGGLETQYCHLARGSLRVKPGEAVKAGQPIGQVGLSGDTEFPHLHLTVREAGKVVDPFAYGAAEGSCNGGRSLWRETPAYQARVVLNTGFSGAAVTPEAVEEAAAVRADASAGVLIAYVRAIGLHAGDAQSLSILKPDGAVLRTYALPPLPRDQDQYFMRDGGLRPPQGWSKGRYEAVYTVVNGGRTVLTTRFQLTL